MKNKIIKFLVFLTFYIPVLITSCNEPKTTKTNNQKSIDSNQELYYHRNYHCFDFVKRCELEILKIKNLDTLIYVNTSQFHGTYEELHGKLTKINDTIYHVKPFKHFIQEGNRCKPHKIIKDTIFFYCDSSLIDSTLKIEYLNGQTEKYKIYSTTNKFLINEQYFNDDYDKIYLSFNHRNPIINEDIEITSEYNEKKYSISFRTKNAPHEFYVIIKENKIMSLNIATSHHQNSGIKFNLLKMPDDFELPNGRELYK